MLPCMIQVLPLSRLGLVWYTENSMQSFEYPPDVIKTDKFFLWTTSVVFLGKFEFDQVSRYRDFFFYFFGVPQSRLLVEKGYFKNLPKCQCSVQCQVYLQRDVCFSAFAVFDQDGDGRITLDELKQRLDLLHWSPTISGVVQQARAGLFWHHSHSHLPDQGRHLLMPLP